MGINNITKQVPIKMVYKMVLSNEIPFINLKLNHSCWIYELLNSITAIRHTCIVVCRCCLFNK